MNQRSSYSLPAIPPPRLLLLLVTVLCLEALAFVVVNLLPTPLPEFEQALFSGFVLTVLATPILWRFFVLPLRRHAEREAALGALISGSAVEGIIIIDEKGVIRSVNPAAERLFGYGAEELLGHDLGRLMASPLAESHKEYVARYTRGGDAHAVGRMREVMGRHKDGHGIPIEVNIGEFRHEGVHLFAGFIRDISERKAQEARLKATAEMLDMIFANIHAGIAYLDRDFNFIRVNRLYAEMDGLNPDDFIGKNHFDFYPDPENEVAFRKVVETGEPLVVYDSPFQYLLHPEWGTTWWDWSVHAVCGCDGSVAGVLLSVANVTARHEAEERRRRSESKFRTLFDAMADPIFILTLDGRFIEVNSAACMRLGYSRDELMAMSVAEIDGPEFAPLVASRLRELEVKGRLVFESEHITRVGVRVPVEINACLIDYDGVGAVVSIAREITERKRAIQALQESEANVRALFDATTESVVLVDLSCRVIAINKTGAARLGLAPEELVGRDILALFPAELAAERRKRVAEVIERGTPLHFEDSRDGRRLANSIYPVNDGQGRVVRLAVYSNDITERQQLLAFDQLLDELDQRSLRGESLPAILDFVCRRLVALFGYEAAWIGRKEALGEVTIAAYAGGCNDYERDLRSIGVRWDAAPEGQGPSGCAIRSGSPQVLKVDDFRFAPWQQAAERNGLRSAIALPLVIRGEVYGSLTLYSRFNGAFDDPPQVARLAGIATRISVGLEMALDQQQLRLLGAALRAAGNGILITNRKGEIEWVNEAFMNMSGYDRSEVVGKNPRFLNSGHHDRSYYAHMWQTITAGKAWCGETVERAKDGHLYTVQQTINPIADEGKITHFVSIHEDITERKASEERIAHMAHHDALTDLPNRVLFYDRLRQAMSLARREGHSLALLFLDLDRFKPVNDTYGHDAGDQLLMEVARRLRGAVRESDTVARLAGDEFTVILPKIDSIEDATRVAEKLLQVLALPYQIGVNEIRTGASLGIALYPQSARDEDDLVRQADAAMYLAKTQRRNGWRLYSG